MPTRSYDIFIEKHKIYPPMNRSNGYRLAGVANLKAHPPASTTSERPRIVSLASATTIIFTTPSAAGCYSSCGSQLTYKLFRRSTCGEDTKHSLQEWQHLPPNLHLLQNQSQRPLSTPLHSAPQAPNLSTHLQPIPPTLQASNGWTAHGM